MVEKMRDTQVIHMVDWGSIPNDLPRRRPAVPGVQMPGRLIPTVPWLSRDRSEWHKYQAQRDAVICSPG